MPKKKLNKSLRELIVKWMIEEKLEKHPDIKVVNKAMHAAIDAANIAIREKYPEFDMAVLRKYKVVRKDNCLKFCDEETSRVYGLEIHASYKQKWSSVMRLEGIDSLADTPNNGGCHNRTVFSGNPELEQLIIDYNKKYDDFKSLFAQKSREYWAFVENCKYLEDVDLVVSLPSDLKEKITGNQTAIAHINPDIIKNITNDFKGE
jgi:hypothetical protein